MLRSGSRRFREKQRRLRFKAQGLSGYALRAALNWTTIERARQQVSRSNALRAARWGGNPATIGCEAWRRWMLAKK